MDKIVYAIILISLISTVQADRWSESDYKYFCAEYSKQVFGWNYDDYYDTDQTNATRCVLYPKRGYPDDFWVIVPDDISGRDRCTFRSDCPARVWAREWFDLAFDQTNIEDQVCGMCNALYYAVRSFTPYLKEDATRDDIMQLLHDFQWIAMETTPSGYCVEGNCGMSCMKAIDVSVEKAILRNDNKWQKIFDAGGIKVVETNIKCSPPVCPTLTCPECECKVCESCEPCASPVMCLVTQDDIDAKERVIDDLNRELIECTPVAIEEDENGVSSMFVFVLVAIIVLVVIIAFGIDGL